MVVSHYGIALQVVLERACKAAAERADSDFVQLLQAQQEEGFITARSTWSAVKAQVRRGRRIMFLLGLSLQPHLEAFLFMSIVICS
jgi:hypothetical protein